MDIIKFPDPLSKPDRPWGRYSDLHPSEIDAILEVNPIAYIPWGALEWHCSHNPIGLDSIKAEGLCVELACRSGGVVLPAIPFGVNTIKPYKGFAHSIDISAELASQTAEELCTQLADEGFRLVVVLTGHYPPEQIVALETGAKRAQKKCSESRFVVWADNQLMEGHYKGDHAGATETSFQLLFDPGSVDLDSLPDRKLTLDGDGVMGDDPREATLARGKAQLKCILEAGLPQIEEMLAEILKIKAKAK